MSKTPRTDVETRLRSGQEVVLAGFARQLEKELAEAKAECDDFKPRFETKKGRPSVKIEVELL